MKSILVKAQIQFDQFSDEDSEMYVMKTINEINAVLRERFPDISPGIFGNNISPEDIEVAEEPDDED